MNGDIPVSYVCVNRRRTIIRRKARQKETNLVWVL